MNKIEEALHLLHSMVLSGEMTDGTATKLYVAACEDVKKLKEVLILLIANDHTTDSKAGLEKRAINREKAINIILHVLNITREEAECLYNDCLYESMTQNEIM